MHVTLFELLSIPNVLQHLSHVTHEIPVTMDTLHINIKHLRSLPSIGSVIMTSSNGRVVAMDTGDNVSGVRE
jgi:hypothetical protein